MSFLRNRFAVLLSVCFMVPAITLAKPATDSKPQDLGQFGSWQAYKKGDICYMVSLAQKSEDSAPKRGKVYAVMTHRPKANSKNVLSLHAGYPYAKGEEVKVTVKALKGQKDMMLFSEKDVAWCPDSKTDDIMADQMTKVGTEMVVEGKPAKGKPTKDIYSLTGASKAYAAINKACGY
jgi:hypothetical protein